MTPRRQESGIARTRQLLRRIALVNASLGIFALYLGSLSGDLVGRVIWIVIGLILLILAAGLWALQRWALFAGLVFYAVATLFTATLTVANALGDLKGEYAGLGLVISVVATVFSAAFAWWFIALLKGGVAPRGLRGEHRE
jgi:hypothetical protein